MRIAARGRPGRQSAAPRCRAAPVVAYPAGRSAASACAACPRTPCGLEALGGRAWSGGSTLRMTCLRQERCISSPVAVRNKRWIRTKHRNCQEELVVATLLADSAGFGCNVGAQSGCSNEIEGHVARPFRGLACHASPCLRAVSHVPALAALALVNTGGGDKAGRRRGDSHQQPRVVRITRRGIIATLRAREVKHRNRKPYEVK